MTFLPLATIFFGRSGATLVFIIVLFLALILLFMALRKPDGPSTTEQHVMSEDETDEV